MSVLKRDLVHHCLYRCQLVVTSERHQHGARSYGRVESLGQTPLRADVEILCDLHVEFCKIIFAVFMIKAGFLPAARCCRSDIYMLVSTVGIKEFPADIYNRLSIPAHYKSRLFSYSCDLYALEIFSCSQVHEEIFVFRADDACHSLL